MSDMKVVYDDVATVSTKLHQVTTDTLPRLTAMQNSVNNLLTDGGGLWLISSSPVLEQKYNDFNTSITQAVNSIPQWANQFDNIVSQLKSLDASIVESANSNG
ncbi:hypothetical protein KIH74_25415 [Kineosporia sp. J2-2]|uniref:WXG100 family type VII secretion target n=1 Tax=Kineosporia corallincola TaxID=2835133 RepID=A0ABS5TMI4_9ACTN|nr:hypothetical protein [Kineosporia corallincola]MBT0772309.1 hypothetical protein [Kineosporia corallincola]